LINLIANDPNNVLVEILDEHDVRVALVPLCIEDPASIGGMRNIRLPKGEFSARVFLIAKPPENAIPNIDGYLATTALRPLELDFDFSGHKFSWK
jgi:hypothetical protein